MIVLDTSAIMAILLNEADAVRIKDKIRRDGQTIVSAGTAIELLVVASRDEKLFEVATQFLREPFIHKIEPVTEEHAILAANAYRQFGKGHGSARLNLGDMFAYALARERNLSLLFKGKDFTLTDIQIA